MILYEKVIFLDYLVNETLTITHFTEWELSSYEKKSMFCQGGQPGPIRSKSFAGCVNKAFAFIEEVENV